MVGRRSLFPFWKAFKERKIVKFRGCVSSSTLQPLFGQPGLHNKAPGGKSTRLSCSCRGTFRSYFATWKDEFTWSWQVFFCLGILCFMPVFWGDDSLWQTCLKWVVQPPTRKEFSISFWLARTISFFKESLTKHNFCGLQNFSPAFFFWLGISDTFFWTSYLCPNRYMFKNPE